MIQRADHFTLYACIDHVHADAMFMVNLFVELNMNYAALVEGGAPIRLPETGRYNDYCVRQRDYTSALTLESSEVAEWVEFLRRNGGTLPKFPLPLGDPSVPCTGDLITVTLMDAHDSDRFEAVCTAAGVRFIGGVFACAAIAERELAGIDTYNVITPTTTRRTAADFQTTGWFTGVVPISVPVAGMSFTVVARAAQAAFDTGMPMANVPIERVLELAAAVPGIRKPGPGVPMLSYLDVGLPPLDPVVMGQWQARNGQLYTDLGAANQIGMWVTRRDTGTTVTVAYPDNPVARESVASYVDLMKMMFLRAAEAAPTPSPHRASRRPRRDPPRRSGGGRFGIRRRQRGALCRSGVVPRPARRRPGGGHAGPVDLSAPRRPRWCAAIPPQPLRNPAGPPDRVIPVAVRAAPLGVSAVHRFQP